MTYAEKLKDPRWQKKRLDILRRDNFTCTNCNDAKSTLHVHHVIYISTVDPWDYNDELLTTLCEYCHQEITSAIRQLTLALHECKFSIQNTVNLAIAIQKIVQRLELPTESITSLLNDYAIDIEQYRELKKKADTRSGIDRMNDMKVRTLLFGVEKNIESIVDKLLDEDRELVKNKTDALKLISIAVDVCIKHWSGLCNGKRSLTGSMYEHEKDRMDTVETIREFITSTKAKPHKTREHDSQIKDNGNA